MIKNITMKNCASYDSTGVNIEYCESQEMLQAKKDEEKALSTEYEKNVWEQIFQKNDLHFKEAFAGCRSKKAVWKTF